jgi:hypothetical protein
MKQVTSTLAAILVTAAVGGRGFSLDAHLNTVRDGDRRFRVDVQAALALRAPVRYGTVRTHGLNP